MREGFENCELVRQVLCFHCPRWEQLPQIALYMDQVTGYVNDVFRPLMSADSEPLLTKAMVNNYVKMQVIQPSNKKKYSRDHLAYLIAICVLKQVFSIPETALLIRSQSDACPLEQAYNYFCEQLEASLRWAFIGETHQCPPDSDNGQLVMRAAQSWADKIFIQKRLEYEYYPQGKE